MSINSNINWYPGHMVKTKKQIIEDLKLIDVVLEILDARCPISSRNPDMNKIVSGKKRIILLNKSDLAESAENEKWVKYFRGQGITAILTDSKLGNGINAVVKTIESLMKESLEQSASKGRIGKSTRVLILGIPNVGKSSLINRLSTKNSAQVGNKPGVTKQKQWIRIANKIELLDTPGVLWPKFDSEEVALNLAYTGTIKDEILDKTEVAYKLLEYLNKNYKENLLERYKLSENDVEGLSTTELMELIGKSRGAISSGGVVDYEKVANIILDDFRTAKLRKNYFRES